VSKNPLPFKILEKVEGKNNIGKLPLPTLTRGVTLILVFSLKGS
jgi:hypothetical protein